MSTLLYVVVLVRYDNPVVSRFLIADSGGPTIFATLSNAILVLRVLALYNQNRYRKWTFGNCLSVQ
jgi:hypothetical protein